MAITLHQFRSGKIIKHIPSGYSFSYSNGGYVSCGGQRAILTPLIASIGFEFEIEETKSGRLSTQKETFLFEDCELSNLNFTQCPHCKKHF